MTDHDELIQKAAAWDKHVMARLQGGIVLQKLEIECLRGDATVVIKNAEAITPFGKIPHSVCDNTYVMRAGDSIVIHHEVTLTINI